MGLYITRCFLWYRRRRKKYEEKKADSFIPCSSNDGGIDGRMFGAETAGDGGAVH